MQKTSLTAGAWLLLATGSSVYAAGAPDLAACAALEEDRERLVCYDRIARSRDPLPDVRGEVVKASAPGNAGTSSSLLADHWELEAGNKRGVFNFRPHRDNFLVAEYTPSPNESPYRAISLKDSGLANAELAFQLGFKLKLAERPASIPGDLWFGYTQRSFWQASNDELSSPFRETNYEPELMAVFPTNLSLAGIRLRFVNLGFVHQSNGQGTLLSRSWNRTYAQIGLERNNFTLLARVWNRLDEKADDDDNPDIVDYLGHGDVVGTYRWGQHELSLMGRYNLGTDKGAAQLGWAFPLAGRLKGYVRYFTGYGHSLIDYNTYKRVVGMGMLVSY